MSNTEDKSAGGSARASAADGEAGPWSESVMTSAMLKALAHPLRRRITKVLAQRECARAADIAADLDEPANSISFHLRVLADAGLIVEAPERARDRRDRVWTAVKGAYSLGTPEHPVEDEVLGGVLMRTVIDDHHELVRRVAAWAPEYVTGRATDVHAYFTQRTVRLTQTEFDAMMTKVEGVMRAAVDAHDPDDPDGRVWEIDTVAADNVI
ncbi:helix-turn-helix transcriptional regulator [Occultella aeris]|uniref:Helix-turn-helix domain protein n=1 Tax=Occultella aeris TaxID=2761496 RepID=A0A7M4DK45_9MICO|nr:helix-turn-helix domain-containing protein [Occultella aeris]VZO37435.1 Helix-turn-helix domain protein [Occultella aeris]